MEKLKRKFVGRRMRWAGQIRRTVEDKLPKRVWQADQCYRRKREDRRSENDISSMNSHECVTFIEVRGIEGTPERGRGNNEYNIDPTLQ